MEPFSGKKVFMYGLGKTGKASAYALQEAGAHVVVWDDNAEKLPKAFSDFPIVNPKDAHWEDFHFMVKSPQISLDNTAITAAINSGLPIVSDIDLLAARSPHANYIAVTGTNGKSTAVELIGHILACANKKVATSGNLSTPPLALEKLEEDGTYVLELNSFQLETLSFLTPDIGIFLNFTPNHLDRHKSVEAYLAIKLRLFEDMDKKAKKIIGIDQEVLAKAAKKIPNCSTVSVKGNKADYRVLANGDLYDHTKKIMNVKEYHNLPGAHNWQNIACAWAALSGNVSKKVFRDALKTFRPLPHRMERVCRTKTMTFINDSKATNDHAAAHALQSFKNIYWICGGLPPAGRILPQSIQCLKNVRAAFVIGSAEILFSDTLKQSGLPTFPCQNLEKAVREAYATAVQEGLDNVCILLAPACEEDDQFAGFEHRGDVFSSLARDIKTQFLAENRGKHE